MQDMPAVVVSQCAELPHSASTCETALDPRRKCWCCSWPRRCRVFLMRTKQTARKSAAQTSPYDSSDEDRPLADWRSQHRQQEDSGSDGGAPPPCRKPRSGAVSRRRAPTGLAEAAPYEQLGAPPPVPHFAAAAPARPGRQLPHGLQEPTLQAAVKALTSASQGTTAAEVEDALITTAEHHANFEEWLDQALVHIATVREVHDEAADLRAAMEVSLADAAARRAAEAAEAATRPLSADLLSKRYGGCKLLSSLLAAAPGEVLVLEPLIGPLKELLHLERQCRGKWYPGPGTDHWFATLAGDLAAEIQTMSAGSAPSGLPPGAPLATTSAAPASAPAAAAAAAGAAGAQEPASAAAGAAGAQEPASAAAGAEGPALAAGDAATDGAGLKRKRSSSADGSGGKQDGETSPADAAGLSDQGPPADEDGPNSKRPAVAADAAAGAGSSAAAPAETPQQDGQAASSLPESSRAGGGGGSSSVAAPAWLPEFTQVVLQRLDHLQQQLALPEVKPPIFVLPEGLAAQTAAEDSDDDVIVVDMMDRKQSAAAQAAAAAAAGAAAGVPAAMAADEVDLAE